MFRAFFALCLSFFLSFSASAQEPEPYSFEPYRVNIATSVKSQDHTGTCWSFSTTSFLESELIRMGKSQYDLSEMWVVRHIYRQKAENYVRRQGNARLSEGGLAHDLINAVAQYGIVRQEDYPGTKTPDKAYDHSKLEKDLIALCDELVVLGKRGTLPANWLAQVDALLDAEFGVVPVTISVNGRALSAKAFAVSLGFKADDYINITSFTHHPFNSPFILEIPDNFSNGSYYNIPLDDLVRTINFALQNGYTMVWDGDVSNKGFASKYGLALVPELEWAAKTEVQKKYTFKSYEKEALVDQAKRQSLFDTQETMDDHLMHLTGMMQEAHGDIFYSIKNSWGEISDMKGYVYASESYLRMNTVGITLHKDALPSDLAQRLGLEPGTGAMDLKKKQEIDARKTKQVPRRSKADN